MAKNGVEGVYTADPRVDPNAEFIPEITHKDALTRGLQVMDSTAFALCMDNNLPIVVFNMADGRQHRPDSVRRARGDARQDMSSGSSESDRRAAGRRQGAHGKSVESTRHEFGSVRTGRASPALLDRITVDYYGTSHPAQAAGHDHRARAAAAHDPAVRQELDQGDRAGDPGVGRRADAHQRRQPDPPGDPGADRGAAQAAGQGRAQHRRGGPRGGAQHPPRRDARPARAQGGRRGRLRRRASRRGRSSRR